MQTTPTNWSAGTEQCPQLRAVAELDFRGAGQHEKGRIDEARTQAVEWGLQSEREPGGVDRHRDHGAARALKRGVAAAGHTLEKDVTGGIAGAFRT